MALRIGSCSWKYDSWKGLVYHGSDKRSYLHEYAKIFNTVEIDQWFWSLFGKESIKLPDKNIVREYSEAVDNEFRFTIKVPNSITLTHFYSHVNKWAGKIPEKNPHFMSHEIFKRFLDSIEPLHSKTGALMFQFEYLNKIKMKSLTELLDRLGTLFYNCLSDIPVAIELRNPNFLNKEYFSFLREQKVHNVFLQGYYMPDIVPLIHQQIDYINDLTVIRLIGPDRKKIERITGNKWNKIVLPKDPELRNIADVIKDLEDRGIKVFVNINNHYEGSAPLTIQKLKELIQNSNSGS